MEWLVALLFAVAAALGTFALRPYPAFRPARMERGPGAPPVGAGAGAAAVLWAALLCLIGSTGIRGLAAVAAGGAIAACLGLLEDRLGAERPDSGPPLGPGPSGSALPGSVAHVGMWAVAVAVAVAIGGPALRVVLTALIIGLAGTGRTLRKAQPGRALAGTGAAALLLCFFLPTALSGITFGISAALLPDRSGRTAEGAAGRRGLSVYLGAAVAAGPLWLLASSVVALLMWQLGVAGWPGAELDAGGWLRYLGRLGRPR